MSESPEYWECEFCGWVGSSTDVLKAPNPWWEGHVIHGCPACCECRLEAISDKEYDVQMRRNVEGG